MKKFAIFLVLLLIPVLFYVGFFDGSAVEINEPVSFNDERFHYAFHSHKEFYGNIEQENLVSSFQNKIYGGIVSHHLLAADDIAQFFAQFRGKKIETIVIVGPNHYEVGGGNILVSQVPYYTPWGIVKPDTKIISKLVDEGVVLNDETPFTREHSISALVSYVAYNNPKAKIVPIVIKNNTSTDQLDLLISSLDRMLPKNAVVIASVDFSHHQNRIVAAFHDDMSISAIETFNYDRLFDLEIDSPPSIYTLLKYLRKKEAGQMTYKRVNSTDITKNFDSNDVTSYLFAHFTKGDPVFESNITALNFGDAMFDRGVRQFIEEEGDPFESIAKKEGLFLKGSDLIIANLEGVITDTEKCMEKEHIFRFSPNIVEMLAKYNFNMFSLANNHSEDCFVEGILDTKQYLMEYDIDYFGGGNIEESFSVRKMHDKKIALIGINEINIDSATLEKFYEKIAKLKKENDFVIVHIHWGYEYNTKPSSIQKTIGHKLIDNGADVVIGHHPHVIQPIEIYKNGVIFYSLGNFIFDQTMPNTREGFGVGFVGTEKYMGFYLFPYRIKNIQPNLFLYQEAEMFCNDILSDIDDSDVCYFEITENSL